ncbi:MAG TPA: PHP domain-containing protein [Candidatus Scatavimonas merdigallinarum]|uniref:PHP domain-containing protein n=1 Tax=Candidatus Scatavimonas merdigallinarum TaxID=2840914 RepID=A0A9D1CUM9_9FIRM|nr:PHP domain-containing protein [Candidatus Scatavimonas merdigallinarum]
MAADLHCHTKLSDGSVAIDELVILAKNKGIPTIAVTDHDTFAGATRAKIFGQRHGVEVIHGAEISTFDYQRKRLVHLLCYMCEHPARLEGLFGKILANRRKAVSIALQKVMRLYPITPEMVAKRAQGSTAIYKQHIMQTLVDAGYADKMYGPLYDKLFNWKIGIAKTNIEYPDVFEVLEQIHDAGGVAVLAHPAVYDTYALLPELAEKGLDGVEVYYPRARQDDLEVLGAIAEAYDLVITGGTDFHGGSTSSVHPIGTCLTLDEQLLKLKKRKAALLQKQGAV